MSKREYAPFNKYILRTPLLSLNNFINLTRGKKVLKEDLIKLFDNPIIDESIFLASPDFHAELTKWKNDAINDDKKNKKLELSLLKYISRMSSRCTPFGLFAGCSMGTFESQTSIKIGNTQKHKRHTRLDMDFLVALSQNLSLDFNLRKKLLYFPNSSLYEIGNEIRYVEYTYIRGTRNHEIVSVDSSEYLKKVIEEAKNGARMENLISKLISDEITQDDATNFIIELIDNQILVSELEPSVTGSEFIFQIKNILIKYSECKEVVKTLDNIEEVLSNLDQRIGNQIELYDKAIELVKSLNTTYDTKYLFQTDLYTGTSSNTLDSQIRDDLFAALMVINKTSLKPNRSYLKDFMNSMYERYEEKEVPLSKALDTELGIPYRSKNDGDINPLIDDLIIPPSEEKSPQIKELRLSKMHEILNNKIQKALVGREIEIEIEDSDIADFTENWNDLPVTISILAEIVEIDGRNMIKFRSTGGSSAGNLLARFCHGDQDINEFTKEIIEKEEELLSDKDTIVAEITHLPDNRVGNILLRPNFRKYEIPYLASSSLKRENQISLDDLTIKAQFNTKIILKSKKLNKVIIPKLTNAHNYSFNTLPLYNFLCDIQNQDIRAGIGFSVGSISNEQSYVPRIIYKNIILREATWNLKKEELSDLFSSYDNDQTLYDKLQVFKNNYKLPRFVMYVESDYELLINLKNLDSVRTLLDLAKNRSTITLKEFLHTSSESFTSSSKSKFTNQVIVSYYKNS